LPSDVRTLAWYFTVITITAALSAPVIVVILGLGVLTCHPGIGLTCDYNASKKIAQSADQTTFSGAVAALTL
jgi:hypothetical protein